MDTLIEANHVSLRFSAPTDKKGSLKKWVLDAVRGRVRSRHFLALDDVTFRIERGEAVGLVGRNGAGKSTLLKLVTGIVNPTAGSIAVRGQVAPLLALGNGLDPRLTGRENIYLNGAILGYEKAYLRAHEADIIDFSELGDFIDAPVRTYSSGMTMRLAFSIATAASPEILILDEVLAVGDAAFQAKCRTRIHEIIADGATVFFVSHSIRDIQELCSRAIWLDKGKIVADGPSGEVCPAFTDFICLPFFPLSGILSRHLPDGTIQIVRFRSRRRKNQLLTADRDEMRTILSRTPDMVCEGIVCRAFPKPIPGSVPLFRFFALKEMYHRFAIGEEEAASFWALPDEWRDEGVACHVFPAAKPGTVPVYRIKGGDVVGFRFAVGDGERDAFLASVPGAVVDGSPFFVFPAPPPSDDAPDEGTAAGERGVRT